MPCTVLGCVTRRVILAGLLSTLVGVTTVSADEWQPGWKEAFPLTRMQDPSTAQPAARFTQRRGPRLSLQSTDADEAQVDPLSATVTIVFDQRVRTVRDAARQVLTPIGYELVENGQNVSPLLSELLDSPLPMVQREMRHLRVREMLRALAGIGHVAVFDHVHRKATFDPRPRYVPIGEYSSPDTLYPVLGQASVLVPVAPDTTVTDAISSNNALEDGWQSVPSSPRSNHRDSAVDVLTEPTERSVLPYDPEFAKRVERLLVDKPTNSLDRVIIRSRIDADRLTPDTERQLRLIVAGFDGSSEQVIIRPCNMTEGIPGARRHTWLIGSALARLGVVATSQAVQTCEQKMSPAADKLTHVVEVVPLVPQSTGVAQ